MFMGIEGIINVRIILFNLHLYFRCNVPKRCEMVNRVTGVRRESGTIDMDRYNIERVTSVKHVKCNHRKASLGKSRIS